MFSPVAVSASIPGTIQTAATRAIALPAPTAVTSPVPETVAAPVLEEVHVTTRPVSCVPSDARVVAESCCVDPIATVALDGETWTAASYDERVTIDIPPDYIGVYIKYTHDLITGLFRGQSTITDDREGEVLEVLKAVAYPDSQATIDAAVLILAQPSSIKPRQIATLRMKSSRVESLWRHSSGVFA